LGAAVGSSPDALHLSNSVRALIEKPELRRNMTALSRELVDGYGTLRVAIALLGSKVLLTPAKQSDAKIAFPWRNSAITRRFFRDPRTLTLIEHMTWWRQTLSRSDRNLLIARLGRVKVGVLRLDWDAERQQAEVSIYLDPNYAGLGLGKHMLRQLSLWVQALASDPKRLVAEIHPDNLASRRAFESAGYRRLDDRHWRLELAI
jgi:RimJ/RimL family protein N-acetyltransferase